MKRPESLQAQIDEISGYIVSLKEEMKEMRDDNESTVDNAFAILSVLRSLNNRRTTLLNVQGDIIKLIDSHFRAVDVYKRRGNNSKANERIAIAKELCLLAGEIE